MFKLAGEGIYNNFPSDKYCSLQKVLQAESMRKDACRQIGSLFWRVFQRLTCFQQGIFLVYTSTSGILLLLQFPRQEKQMHL